jgi:hypothetical protein
MNFWRVPPMWKGQTVAILASGPSMTQATANTVRDAHLPTIVINTTWQLAPWADLLYAADASWWERYKDEVKAFPGIRVSACVGYKHPDLLFLCNTGKAGFDEDPSCVRTGGNSGYQAIHVALHAHARRILLLGFDMCHPQQQAHWHGRHPEPLRNVGEGVFNRWLKHFADLAPVAKSRGTEIINCTPNSALVVWPQVSLEVALHRLRNEQEVEA